MYTAGILRILDIPRTDPRDPARGALGHGDQDPCTPVVRDQDRGPLDLSDQISMGHQDMTIDLQNHCYNVTI
uniref:Uncharacterized protein n=1 Tax=Heliothis virescens TaxID=7102 RepID=A0A2A4IXG5_HELVI